MVYRLMLPFLKMKIKLTLTLLQAILCFVLMKEIQPEELQPSISL